MRPCLKWSLIFGSIVSVLALAFGLGFGLTGKNETPEEPPIDTTGVSSIITDPFLAYII